jgi:molybdenum cofactor synthesis domain-containing protein
MISVDEALLTVLSRVNHLGVERVSLDDASGRMLAQEVCADIDLPPFDRARMDGYALRSADARTAPVRLRAVGEIAAGEMMKGRLGAGQAIKIFTGAPIPEGADAVQKVEVTESDGRTVLIKEAVEPGQFITPRASEARAGETLARRGREIGPAEMAVLASFGYSEVEVTKRPRVAVISTGTELVEVSARPSAAQIRNSNSYTIACYAGRAGAAVENLGTVKDSFEETCDALRRASLGRDIVITSGGVSMGDYDLVKAALTDLGAEIFFDKVRIRPGKPTVFAQLGNVFFFGLPGNPVSTSVTFNVLARPAIRKMLGEIDPLLPVVRAGVARSIKDASSRRSYLPARLFIEGGRALAEPLKWGGSSDLVAFMQANALIIVPEETREIAAGETVEVFSLNRF